MMQRQKKQGECGGFSLPIFVDFQEKIASDK